MLTRRNFILLYTAILLFFGIPYVVHLTTYYAAKAGIDARNRQFENAFQSFKAELEANHRKEYGSDLDFFNHYFSLNDAVYYTDTIITTFIYWDHLEVKRYRADYLECLADRAKSAAINNQSDIELQAAFEKIRSKYGAIADKWIKQLGKERFLISRNNRHCSDYFTEYDTYRVNPQALKDFERFITEVQENESILLLESELNKMHYETIYKEKTRSLNANEMRKLEQRLGGTSLLYTENKRLRFNSSGLGNFDYYLPYEEFNEAQLDAALGEVFNEMYRTNSLPNGAMPYAYCYGAGNSGASTVKVNGGSSDVLVSVRNTSGRVIRHFYVKARHSFSVDIPNGSYYIHFYYGSGWNPKKYMTKAHCGSLLGGFIRNEVVDKVPQKKYLFNTEYTVTLYEVANGNLETRSSSVAEAFGE